MSSTLKELGRLAGVHPSTVARVLNDDPRQRVSAEVRQRIQALAVERGYQPNRVARSLRTKRSSVIGTLIPDIANPYALLIDFHNSVELPEALEARLQDTAGAQRCNESACCCRSKLPYRIVVIEPSR